ncbi:Pyridoxal phosphate-dependent transferase major region subdomain 2 [Penicillium angulare]|uniref:Pyridoxal phosphate-dependent transferase major region subdomain 2 n=1 Tax=Penicillium angulare TaxID=116970 RepID=UPI0025403C3B|nr:Pyridoxal phosphate-dependent transferase major region subdomain 2 [Penicillium angulare]KAJ5256560.1 Pyridoxal phosphate-dependent transferase major region subdomain 2 [Penicillium angulare]
MSMGPLPQKSLAEALANALKSREAKSARRRLTILPQETVDFSSNDFLSLSTASIYRNRLLAHLNKAPESFPFSSGGSRLLDGNSAYAEELEQFVAEFHHAPTALLFNSGFDANIGVLSSIPQPGDLVVYDEYIHASIHEGIRLSRAGRQAMFSHSSPIDLRKVLESSIQNDKNIQDGTRNIFIVIESIYSMDGDIAPIKEFLDIVDELLPCGNGYFIVDEAHATGVFGPRGAGIVQELGVQERIFIRVHTFGKALASHGAVVLCGPEVREYLINYARSLIYTTALGFPFLAAIRTAYELLSSGETELLQCRLQSLVTYLHTRLASLQIHPSVMFEVDHFPESAIFALRTFQPRELASFCQKMGIVVRAIMAPTVPKGKERVRVCLHAGNTEEEIDSLARAVQHWLDTVSSKRDAHL